MEERGRGRGGGEGRGGWESEEEHGIKERKWGRRIRLREGGRTCENLLKVGMKEEEEGKKEGLF